MYKVVIAFTLVAALAATSLGMLNNSGPLVVDAAEISLNARGERTYNGELFTGDTVSYYAPDRLASFDQFVEGRRQGHSKQWFESGILASEIYYEGGRREGFARFWWSNGAPKSETFYIDGKKQGEAWSWYSSGAKFKRTHFSQGRPTGIQQAWRENGDLFSNFEYKNGRVYGLNKSNTCMGVEDEVLSPGYYKDQSS